MLVAARGLLSYSVDCRHWKELYSVLVGGKSRRRTVQCRHVGVRLKDAYSSGIPSRPDEAMNADDVEEAVRDDSQANWQMELVSTFFDSCVPNMPGCKYH